MRRVVITGLGAVTPLGLDFPSTWAGLLAGKSGVANIQGFDASSFEVRIAGEVKGFEPEVLLDKKDARHMDRYAQFAVVAAIEAWGDSGLTPADVNPERSGVYLGAGLGGLSTLEKEHQTLSEKGPRRVSPFMIPMLIGNMAAGLVAIRLGLTGPTTALVTACASGTQAVGEAFRMIRDGYTDLMVAGGAEAAVTPLGVAGFTVMKALSTRNEEPELASRPFDRDRDGFVIGEGAGVLTLEELEHALARGAHIYAELKGYAMTSDAYHMTAPHPEGVGAKAAMLAAIRDAGIAPEEVDYINAHGTSTPMNDKIESHAIRAAFGDHADQICVNSTKSMTGHLLGAAGGVEAAVVARSIFEQKVHPTINLENPGEECDLDYVPEGARDVHIKAALSNSFGFGGHNAVIVVTKYE